MKFFRKIKKIPRWLLWPVYALSRLLACTYRVTIVDPANVVGTFLSSPAILAIWHNRLLFMQHFLPRRFREKLSVLISRSRDGEYVADFIRFYGLNVVRGSSSKGGAAALHALVDEIKIGHSPVLTVDGPRGPKYQVHPGAPFLSTECNVPIFCASLNAKSYWQFKSWDGMQIPKPFSKVTLEITPPEMLTTSTRDEQCEELRQRLLSITHDNTPSTKETKP